MKTKLLGMIAALALSVSVSQASIIEVDFAGTITSGGSSLPDNSGVVSLGGRLFIAVFQFDTSQGVLTTLSDGSHHLDAGLIGANIAIAGLGTYGGLYKPGSYLTWNDDFSAVDANAGLAAGSLWIVLHMQLDPIHNIGSFQFGACPSVGHPCGFTDNIASVNFPSVPGPIVGAGLPGVLLFGGLLAWWRRRNLGELYT